MNAAFLKRWPKAPEEPDFIVKLISISGVSRFNRRRSGFINAERQQTFGEEELLALVNQWIDMRDYEFLTGADSQGLLCVLIYARKGKWEWKNIDC